MSDAELLQAIDRRRRVELDRAACNRNGHLRATDWPTRIKADTAAAESNQLRRAIADALRDRGGEWRGWRLTGDGLSYYRPADLAAAV